MGKWFGNWEYKVSKSKKSFVKPLIIIIVLAGAAFGGWKYYSKKKEAAAAPVYREEQVTRGTLDRTVLATGEVLPQNRLEIKPPIAGRVEQVLVDEGDKVRKGQIIGWMSSTERAALLDSARAKGADELKRWEEMYRPTPILAPIEGTVILRSVEPGQTFTNTEAVVVLSDRLTVKAKVDETDLAQIKIGQRATIVLDAYATEPVEGKVDKLAFEAVTTSNVTTYTTDVVPIKTPDFMRSGMTANVTFFAESRENVILISTEAIRSENGQTFVLLKSLDPKVPPAQRPIKIGLTDGKRTEITEGLKEGETVLISDVSLDSGNKSANPFMPGGGRRPSGSGSGSGNRGR
ncbi:MAG: HlyD family efflux transporter periplasmic adaptor subunit [Proteobacteria bacterium]|nr:MAG: HlyD family efflux transporter periplasmic adaptor subunit [Pseudomonadota bacterium]